MDCYISGTCEEMCPSSELEMRKREKLLHYYELQSNESFEGKIIAVKEFSRSAAGIRLPKKSELRTVAALRKTIHYLITQILPDKDNPYNFVYDFIFDRFRAIRQEIVMQNFNATVTLELLSPIVMFLSYSIYELCEENIKFFDSKICHQHLQECLKKVLCCYDELDNAQVSYNIRNRILMESLYIVFNLGSTDAIQRILKLPKSLRKSEYIHSSLTMSIEYHRGNYYRVLLLMKRLPNILCALASLRVQNIRRNILLQFTSAYQSKVLTVPLKWLSQILAYSDMNALANDCRYYGLAVNQDISNVKFENKTFDIKQAVISSRHEDFVNEKFSGANLSELILMKKIE